MPTALLAVDPDDQRSAPDLQNRFPSGEPPWNRVAVPEIRDEALPTDAPGLGHDDLVRRPAHHRMQLLFLELRDRDHAGRGVDPLGVDGVAPALGLSVEVLQAGEGPSEKEVALDEPDGALDLALGFGPIGPAQAGPEAVVLGEVVKERVPAVLFGTERPLEDDLGHVIVEDLVGVAAEVVEGVQVALDEPRGVDLRQELEEAAPGVPEDHREAVEVPAHAVLLEESKVAEVDLGLDPGRRLVAEDGRDGPIALEGTDEVLDDGVAAAVSPLADLLEETDGAQVILSEAGAEVVRERVDGAGPWCAGCPAPRRSLEEEGVDRVAVYPDLAGDSADGQLLGGEFSDKGLFFHSKQRVPPPFPLLRRSDRAVHFPGAGSGLFCRATDKGPEAYGFRGQVWTLPRIAKVIEREFGVRHDPSWVRRLLLRLGFSPQKPELRAIDRDEREVARFRHRVWPQYRRRLHQRSSTLVMLDESGKSETPTVVVTWAPRGQTPRLRHLFGGAHVSMIAGITPHGKLHYQVYSRRVRSGKGGAGLIPRDLTPAILRGHVLDVLRMLPEEFVHCVVTSPPYWGLRAYGTEPQVWGGTPEHPHE